MGGNETMTKRYEVMGTDEFFLHIRDNDEWPEDKDEAYIGDIWKVVRILNKQDHQIKEVMEDNKQYQILVESLKDENQKLKLRLKDLWVEYY